MSDLSFQSPPRADLDTLERALLRAGSPAAPRAAALYAIPVTYGLDPAVAWGFFWHESTFGTEGSARHTLNWGNIRVPHRTVPWGRCLNPEQKGAMARYASWEDSLDAWCQLISRVYIPSGRDTVARAIPSYAPAGPPDYNQPDRYIAAVLADVARWEAQSRDLADPWAAWGEAHPLAPEQRGYAIPQRWLRSDLGAATGPELHPAPGVAVRAFARGIIVWFEQGNRTEVVQL